MAYYKSKHTGEEIDAAVDCTVDIGDVGALLTTDKTSLVAAVNENTRKKLEVSEVKANGNIVVTDGNGTTKEYMAATPSGDPLHWLYVARGAVYNEGEDKTYATPWAAYVETEEEKTYVHKKGCWRYGGLGDLTNLDMSRIVSVPKIPGYVNGLWEYKTARVAGFGTSVVGSNNGYAGYETFFYSTCDVCSVGGSIANPSRLAQTIYTFGVCKVKYISGVLQGSWQSNTFDNATNIRVLNIAKLSTNLEVKHTKYLSKKCVKFIIEQASTTAVTITLHSDVYDKCMADADVLAALKSKPNVTLAKG